MRSRCAVDTAKYYLIRARCTFFIFFTVGTNFFTLFPFILRSLGREYIVCEFISSTNDFLFLLVSFHFFILFLLLDYMYIVKVLPSGILFLLLVIYFIFLHLSRNIIYSMREKVALNALCIHIYIMSQE